MCIIAGTAAWGQAQDETSGGTVKVDRAASYYHYMLARMYAEMAFASRGRNRQYVNEAIDNCKAAIKADPRTPALREECAQLLGPRFSPFLDRPASRQDHPLP